jgi:translin
VTLNTAIITELEAVHAARETALKWARELIRQCATAIRATHRHEWGNASQLLAEAGQTAQNLRERLADFPAIFHAGYTQDALKEYAEAHLTYALVHGDELPTHGAIGVEPAAYLNGMAEAASELRRYILDGLRSGNVAEGERLLTQMDDIYSFLVTVDFPDAVTGGLRRTTDALRAVLERTRGDLTSAVRQDQLIAALARFETQTGATPRPAMESPDATVD